MLQQRYASGGRALSQQAHQCRAPQLLLPLRHRTRRPAGCRAVPHAGAQPLGDLAKSYARKMNRQNRAEQASEQKQRVETAAAEAKEEAEVAVHASEQASASVSAAAQAASVGMGDAAVAAADATNAAAAEAMVAADSADVAAGTAVRTADQAGGGPAVEAPAAEAVGAAVEAAEAASTAGKDAEVAEAVREAAAVEMISEEVEVIVEAQTLQQRAQGAARFLTTTGAGKGISIAAGLFLTFTFAIAVYRTYQKYTSVGAVRRRQVDKNKQLVDSLNKYLPDQREKLTPSVAKGIVNASGFTPVEVFRKYLWYLLRERAFDTRAVSDMVQLKHSLGLDDAQVAEALRERAQRIYDKYGTLMLQTSGMTPEGVERKAACQALYSKMLYLTECQALLDQEGEAFKTTDLRMILGATDEDSDRLRIVSLEEMSIERLDRLMDSASASEEGASEKQNNGGNAGQ